MSELLPRTAPVASVSSATERPATIVRAVPTGDAAPNGTEAEGPATIVTERSAAAADYVRIQADIADVLARISPSSAFAPQSAEAMDRAADALIPKPVIILPLPPASSETVAFVAQVAQSMARQAAQTRAAQANATPLLVVAAAS